MNSAWRSSLNTARITERATERFSRVVHEQSMQPEARTAVPPRARSRISQENSQYLGEQHLTESHETHWGSLQVQAAAERAEMSQATDSERMQALRQAETDQERVMTQRS